MARKDHISDAAEFARIYGFFSSRGKVLPASLMFAQFTHFFFFFEYLVWGFIWLVQAITYFALGVIIGLVAFKVGNLRFFFLLVPSQQTYLFISKTLKNKRGMQLTSFLFQAPKVVLFLWRQALWFYPL
jgi:hypothetical protein